MRCGAGRKIGSCLFSGLHETMDKKRTIFYFDGFNLHHGMLKNTPQRWLDLEKFAKAILPRPEEHEIVRINYFTARIKYDPSRPTEAFNQDRYLEALTAYPLVRVVEGYYKRFKVKLPFAKEPCKSCEKADYGIVWKTEEKRSDVNLATEMMADIYRDAADAFVLVSGDADLAAPLCFIRHVAKRQTLVFNPHDMVCEELRKYSSYFKIIPRDLPTKCELPEEVQTPCRKIRRPPEWR